VEKSEVPLDAQLAGAVLPTVVSDAEVSVRLCGRGRMSAAEATVVGAAVEVAVAELRARRASAPAVLVAVADALDVKVRVEKAVRPGLTMRAVAEEAGVTAGQVSCVFQLAADRVTVATLHALARWAGLRLDVAADVSELDRRVEAVCRAVHDAIRAWQVETGVAMPVQPWGEATDAEKRSTRASVRAALAGAGPEAQHAQWMAQRLADGWVRGPVRDPKKKTNPNLVPYDELPEVERAKDRLVVNIVSALTNGDS
jgi:RyR domain